MALEVTGLSEGESPGAVLVELGRVADAVFVARTVADELGVTGRPGHRL